MAYRMKLTNLLKIVKKLFLLFIKKLGLCEESPSLCEESPSLCEESPSLCEEFRTVDESLLDTEDDPALLAFLDYLDQQMAAHPELIVEADYAQLERIAKLVEGVELEDDKKPASGRVGLGD
jgi:hypothetical protein